MPLTRSNPTLIACLLLALPAEAQDATSPRRVQIPGGPVELLHAPTGTDTAKVTVWVRSPGGARAFADSRQYLDDLQARWREKGASFAVVLPTADAKVLSAEKPRFAVAAAAAADEGNDDVDAADAESMPTLQVIVTTGIAGRSLSTTPDLDGVVDVVAGAIAGRDLEHTLWAELQVLLAGVTDGGDFAAECQRMREALPHSGRAHAATVLFHWWSEGDLQAARDAVDAAITALANDAVPMAVFADLVLRGDHADRSVAKKLSMAMAPVAAGAPDGVFSQLVYLRALLRAGQDRLAGRVAARLPKLLEGQPRNQLIFAETLMEAENPLVFRDLAERAINKAEGKGLRQWTYCARHKVLKKCGDDKAAADLMVAYRKNNLSSSGLNNDAWYLMVRPDTMGRFDTLALAQCEEMQRIAGGALDYGSKDTVALALFLNGRIDEAIELQEEATKASGNAKVYVGRLTRYRATKEMLAKAAQSSAGTKR